MLVTTLVNAVSTQNAAGSMTNPTKTTFSATTTAFALEAVWVSPAGQVSAQSTCRVWFQNTTNAVTASAANFPQQAGSPHALDFSPKNQSNGTSVFITDALAAMGTTLFCWVELPTITAAGGTLTVSLIEMN